MKHFILFLFLSLSVSKVFGNEPKYKVLKSSDGTITTGLLRTADNAAIPFDEKNRDYIEYQKWISEGNTPFEIVKSSPTYKDLRAKEYPSYGDQLDLIMKTFAYLKSKGIDIGTDGELLINLCTAVKNKYPKQ